MNTKPVIPVGTQRAVTRRDRNPFSYLQHEIDRLFDGVSRNIPGLATTAMPSMDISETDKVIEITAEINVADSLLTIRGEKKNEREKKTRTTTLSSAVTARSPARSSFQRALSQRTSRPRLPTAC